MTILQNDVLNPSVQYPDSIRMKTKMREYIFPILFIAAYFLLFRYLLPAAGVAT